MPSLKQLIKDKLARMEKVPNAFSSSVQKSQRQIFDEILTKLDQLELEGGAIVNNMENMALIEEIGAELQTVIEGSEYLDAVTEFVKQFKVQKDINEEFLKKAFGEVEIKEVYEQAYLNARNNAVNQLAETAVRDNVDEFKSLLQNSISTSENYTSLVGNVRTLIEGNSQIDGSLYKFSKTYASDLFTETERNYTQSVANDLGIEWYTYVGGEIDTTREFCLERVGKYYHKKEVEAWATLNWSGKKRGTTESTIFSFCGGWNCGHSLLPVDVENVPSAVIQRNLDSGNVSVEDLPDEVRSRVGV